MNAPLPKNVRTLGWISFLTDTSSEMIFPLLPAFVTTVLGGGPAALGLIEGVAETTASLLKLFSGVWSDRARDKRRFVRFGYGLSAAMRSLMALVPHWTAALGVRFGDRIGKGLRSAPRDALIADAVPFDQRGRAFGYHRMMDHAGAVAGSFAAALLLWLLPKQFRLIFAFSILPSAATLLFLAKLDAPATETPAAPGKTFSPKDFLSAPARLKSFLALVFLFNLGNATDAFILLKLQEAGLPVPLVPLLWAAFHVVKAASNDRLGRLSDKVRRGPLIAAGWTLYALSYFAMAFCSELAVLVAVFLAYGTFYGLTEGPEKALVADLSSREKYGASFGAYHFLVGVSLLPASFVFGLVWQSFGPASAFAAAGSVSLLAATGLALWQHHVKTPA